MTDAPQQFRAAYRPSGKAAWFKLLVGLLLATGVTIVMAWCLYLALQHGFYLIFFAPLIASLAVAGAWHRVLTWSHCRNRRVAIAISFALALLLYFGYYYVGLLQLIGVQNAHRVDLLPRYLQF